MQQSQLSTFTHRGLLWVLMLAAVLSLFQPPPDNAYANSFEVVVSPTLAPPYAGNTCESYWLPNTTASGTAYYTMNVNFSQPEFAANSATWQTALPQSGYYRVEAFVPNRSTLTWPCAPHPQFSADTSDARYQITHTLGSTTVQRDQMSVRDGWLNLGTYLFGSSGQVFLGDLNNESSFARLIAYSSVRFVYVGPEPAGLTTQFLPIVTRNNFVPSNYVVKVHGQGFDACMLGDAAALAAWRANSPYQTVNLYIGGVSYPGYCRQLTAQYVSQLAAQDWTFILTWVGPQAPCTSFGNRMSDDPGTTYQQGRQQADLALARATQLGLRPPGGQNTTLIYYNVEAFGSSPTQACRNAVSSFMNGWSQRLREMGSLAGGYGSPCTSHISDWATTPNPPDFIWIAWWLTPAQYRPDVSVFTTSPTGHICNLHNSLWVDQQRLRQYAGDHNEQWGGVTMNIDSNVLWGGVVNVNIGGGVAGLSDTPILDTPTLSMTQTNTGWLESAVMGGAHYLLHENSLWVQRRAGAAWQPTTWPGGIARAMHFSSARVGWLALQQPTGELALYATQDGGETWQAQPTPNTPPGALVQSLHMDTNGNGHLTVRLPGSAALSQGLLYRTADDGQTWQAHALPFYSPVHFSSPDVAWQAVGPLLYRSTTGGQTWVEVSLPETDPETLLAVTTPQFDAAGVGRLALTMTGKPGPRTVIYTSLNNGSTWQAGVTLGGVETADAWVALMNASDATTQSTPPTLPEGNIVWLNVADSGRGFAYTQHNTCVDTDSGRTCTQTGQLWLTRNGGATWQAFSP